MDKVVDKLAQPSKSTKWGSIISHKPLTRNHGGVNIIEKATAYKRKQNLEVPPTFKGKSFSSLDPNLLVDQATKINISIGGDDDNRNKIINDLVDDEQKDA